MRGRPSSPAPGWLIRRDPYLAYQLGRNLNYEFRDRDEIFSDLVSQLGGRCPTGRGQDRQQPGQLLGCHNVPSGSGGPNFAKDSGMGRNTPHYYGAGIVEMLALQIRAELLDELDEDESGWVSAAEAMNADPELEARAIGGQRIDFGDPRLSGGSTGTPSLTTCSPSGTSMRTATRSRARWASTTRPPSAAVPRLVWG